MARQRRSFSADFKARVALEALLREQKAISELAREFDVHPSLIREWRKLLLDTLSQAFSRHKTSEEKKALTFRVFYILIFCACLGLVGTKLVASIWIPEWDPLFYVISGVLGVIGIGKLALKAIRLKLAEFRLRKRLIVLHPLHYQVRKPLTLGRIALQAVQFATLCALLAGGVWYVQESHLLPFQTQAPRMCVSQPLPMPKVSSGVPALNTWQQRGNALFGYNPKDGILGTPSLTISNTAGTSAWAYTPQQELAGKRYQYADWYNSNVQTSLVVQYVLNGKTKYQIIDAKIPPTKGWHHYSVTFNMPGHPGQAQVLPVTVMHQITGEGILEVSGVVLHQQTGSFVRPLISLTFDDGWRSQYTNAFPLLCRYNMAATFYLVSGYVQRGYPDYLLPEMVRKLAESGMEIGDQTVDHQPLPLLSSASVEAEIADSKAYLEQFGQVTDFAAPYGAVNAQDVGLIRKVYQSQRSMDAGVNTADKFDAYHLLSVPINADEKTGSFAQIKPFIDLAIKTRTWLILDFHQVDARGGKYFTNPYNASPALLEEILSYIHTHHIQPMTIKQGLSEVYQQELSPV
jgi:peptidoglycan/xylan/chitin deacetylase (PgdA/CDA1 family)